MRVREFARAGHWPTLVCAFLYFDLSFMLWMLLGALGVFIAQEFGLTPAEKGLLVALPILSGAALRLVLGAASDRWGARRVGIAGMLLTALPLVWGGFAMSSFADGLGVGVLLGVAGASFAVALPLASRWYPPRYQGIAMGIAGAGNSGTVLAALFAPRLAEHFGWRGVFQLALIPLVIVLCAFALFARDNPQQPARTTRYAQILRERDLWWLNLFYTITFGGFVGLASFLPIFFCDQYGCTRVAAGTWAAACVFAGSFLRPFGGALADRLGGVRVLGVLYVIVTALGALLAQLPAFPLAVFTLVLMSGSLGMGNGAVFQLVGKRFHREVGLATGMVGACGGIGGFLLPSTLGVLKQVGGSYGFGFAAFALAAAGAALALTLAHREWQRTWATHITLEPTP
ncbi:MAG: NarK/NasA family nitrate transporter [Deltaproteobacteria bacterium]|nr:NarK/NasA family nitrate transporter [Deltaproteobacteria bacterium]MBI3389558.1 NarK/NasA family nitrate transporter [Deltaproteobacteria bacterium]